MAEERIGRTDGTKQGSEYSHYVSDRRRTGPRHDGVSWHVFNVEDCERCGADTEAPNAVGWTTPEQELARVGMRRLTNCLPELQLHESTGGCYCPQCWETVEAEHKAGLIANTIAQLDHVAQRSLSPAENQAVRFAQSFLMANEDAAAEALVSQA